MRPRAHQLDTELRDRVADALRTCPSGEAASDHLAAAGFDSLLEEFAAENLSTLRHGLAAGKFAAAVINDPSILHYPSLVPVSAEAREALATAVSNGLARSHFPLTKLWAAYADALLAFPEVSATAPQVPQRLSGYEKHFAIYLRYMTATTAADRARHRAEIAESFARRNRDRRLRDWNRLDGDGESPVNWDFRLYSLDRAG